MALDVEGFISKPQEFEGVYKAAEQMERNRYRQEQQQHQRDVQQQATTSFVSDYFDDSNFLTGTNFDPVIGKELKEAKKIAFDLAYKGADKATIMNTLANKISKINEYSANAKVIDNGVKNSTQLLKPVSGYNAEKINALARKEAYDSYKKTGKIDPDINWVDEAMRKNRMEVTNDKAFTDAFSFFKPETSKKKLTTITGIGKSNTGTFNVTAPPYMQFKRDEKGNMIENETGVPEMEVVGTTIQDRSVRPEDLKPEGDFLRSKEGVLYNKKHEIINEKTGKPYKVLDQGFFDAFVNHNPDAKDRILGLTGQHFKDEGHEVPPEDSEAFQLAARSILYDMLEKRGGYSVQKDDMDKQTTFADKLAARAAGISININSPKEQDNEFAFNYDEYPYVNGKKDFTPIFDNVVTGKKYGQPEVMKDVLFDEDKKMISYNGGAFVSIPKFIQDNRLQGKELKIAKSLMNYKPSATQSQKPSEPQGVSSGRGSGSFYDRLPEFGKKVVDTVQKAVSGKPKEVKVESYSRKELKDNEWTDEQINQAVKLGKIKLK